MIRTTKEANAFIVTSCEHCNSVYESMSAALLKFKNLSSSFEPIETLYVAVTKSNEGWTVTLSSMEIELPSVCDSETYYPFAITVDIDQDTLEDFCVYLENSYSNKEVQA